MSWDQTPLTQEAMKKKVRESISEAVATSNLALVPDLGEIDVAVLNDWADRVVKFAFKILRNAKAISLVMDEDKPDRPHIAMAFAYLTKDQGPPNQRMITGNNRRRRQ